MSSIILSLGSACLNRGSRNVQISRRLLNSELPYLLSRSTLTTHLICAVRELSVFLSIRISWLRRVRSGRTAEMVLFISAERASVSFPRGPRVAITELITSKSCWVGIRWDTFLSLAKTIRMASYCSVILSSLASDDPQGVTQSAFRLWRGSCFSCWALARSLFFFRLREKVAITCWQTLRTLVTLGSAKAFRTARSKLCPKHLNHLEWRSAHANFTYTYSSPLTADPSPLTLSCAVTFPWAHGDFAVSINCDVTKHSIPF